LKLLHRTGYYLGGFSIGLIVLAFFLNGKKASCSYSPEARTLKNIGTKKLVFSSESEVFMSSEKIDTLELNYILYKGDVVFSESEPRKEPCGIYRIEGTLNKKDAALTIENCKNTATLKSIEFLD
jgi:hypothetical protein